MMLVKLSLQGADTVPNIRSVPGQAFAERSDYLLGPEAGQGGRLFPTSQHTTPDIFFKEAAAVLRASKCSYQR